MTRRSSRATCSTSFIDERPQLLRGRAVEGPRHEAAELARRRDGQQAERRERRSRSTRRGSCPAIDLDAPAARRVAAAPARARPRRIRPRTARADAPSRSPTRPSATRTSRCSRPVCARATSSRVAPYVARMTPELFSVEAWGGATYDVALRFLGEDPWERLRRCARRCRTSPIQMLLRGRNTVGYTPYPTEVTDAFVREAAATGVDIFRIFDALNDVDADASRDRRRARDRHRGRRGRRSATPATCSTPPRTSTPSTTTCASPSRSSTRARTSSRSRTWRACCAPRPPRSWCRRCASASICPCTFTRTTPPVASSRRCSPRARPARTRWMPHPHRWPAPRASPRSRPSSRRSRTPSATPASTSMRSPTSSRTGRPCGTVYARSSRVCPGPTGRVYHHEIPGGQLSNLRQQAIALGLADDFELHRGHVRGRRPDPRAHPEGDARRRRSSATSRSHLAAVKADPADFEANPQNYDIPDSVVGFMAGELGDLPGGWPEPFRTKVLAGPHTSRSRSTPLTDAEDATALAGDADGPSRRRSTGCCSRPRRSSSSQMREVFGDLSAARHARLPLRARRRARSTSSRSTRACSCYVGLEAIGEADDKGMRTVMTTLNGQLRPVFVRDRSIAVESTPGGEGRHLQARPGRRAVLRRGHGEGRGRRHRRGGSAGRLHRGDEDGSGDHRARRRRGRAPRDRRRPSRWKRATFWSWSVRRTSLEGRHPPRT